MATPPSISRVIIIVLDGVGCGALPDAPQYGDSGANTLGHISHITPFLELPNLARWGIGHLTYMPTVSPIPLPHCIASFGRLRELSCGKDTTSGHWEMAGIVIEKPFNIFPQGFPQETIDAWVKENGLSGILGNCAASGTEIIQRLGEEHIATGKPILYTSADSVWQIAAHEEIFGLDKLYEISKSARRFCDELQVARVIARPFIGKARSDFKRTHHRKDFSQTPPQKTMMEFLIEAGYPTVGIGKIWNIFNGRGIQKSHETEDNAHGMKTLLEALELYDRGLLFFNLIDFDMLYGHRRDVTGFAKALMELDRFLPTLEEKLTPQDLVIVTADHGNDPTFHGTDHTREHVPLLVYQKNIAATPLGDRNSFSDIGQTTIHALTGQSSCLQWGTSFLEELYAY